MLKDLIIKNKLYGKYNYEGIHLKKILNKIKIEIKKGGLKVDFEHVKTENNLGIQICDLFAGMTNELISKNETLNLENFYYFCIYL